MLVCSLHLTISLHFATGLTWSSVCSLHFTLTNSSCLFSQVCVIMTVSSFKTGTTIIISQHLENVLSSQCYLNVELINPECLVMSMSRVAVGGMTNGTMITYWIIQLTYRISSDLQLMIKIS